MEPRFTVETERADHVIGNRAGFNAFASWKDLHPDVGSPEPPLVFSVVANVEEENGCTSHYTVAEFFSSRIAGEFATDGEAAANVYAAALNQTERRVQKYLEGK